MTHLLEREEVERESRQQGDGQRPLSGTAAGGGATGAREGCEGCALPSCEVMNVLENVFERAALPDRPQEVRRLAGREHSHSFRCGEGRPGGSGY